MKLDLFNDLMTQALGEQKGDEGYPPQAMKTREGKWVALPVPIQEQIVASRLTLWLPLLVKLGKKDFLNWSKNFEEFENEMDLGRGKILLDESQREYLTPLPDEPNVPDWDTPKSVMERDQKRSMAYQHGEATLAEWCPDDRGREITRFIAHSFFKYYLKRCPVTMEDVRNLGPSAVLQVNESKNVLEEMPDMKQQGDPSKRGDTRLKPEDHTRLSFPYLTDPSKVNKRLRLN